MNGTIVNALAIAAGSLLGLLFKKGIPETYKQTIMQAVSLAVILIGIQTALKSDDILMVILSLAIGSVVGEFARIEYRLESLGQWLENRFSNQEGSISNGFVTASLVFCVGSMAIVGSLESGLTGNQQTLYAKSALDGITSIIFASTLGVGVILSSVAVLLYQGAITILAVFIKPYLVPEVVAQMSSAGGVLIAAIGINLLGPIKIKVGNMLPAVFIPLIYYALNSIFY
ncbi:MAG: DUF554 domain-containing protein [Proteobacteria bacterium]|nr:DUF554 domain-containing protein [Pseudomonadota bacterium]